MKSQSPEPGGPKISMNITDAMRKAGYWHTTGRFAGKPNMSTLQTATGLTYSTINDFVNHAPGIAAITFDALARFCSALQCTPGDLLTYTNEQAVPMLPLERYFRENPTGDPYGQQRDPALSRF